MKIKFTDTAYQLFTRELIDARLSLTFMAGDHSMEFIQSEIRNSSKITILEDDDTVVAEYLGFSDLVVIRAYETGACNVEIYNNFLLAQTMLLANRVDTLESQTSEMQDKTSELDERASELEDKAEGFDQSQENQDDIISDILDEIV